jgi:hypothetical protein
MSISYHGVIGHRRPVTLPSVETWGANMSILRDPPKSIHTRKIDKVSETSKITQTIQESGDRVGEAIKVYARGMNPMVAVSYGNEGNNGGQRVAGTNLGTNRQSFLPYRVMREGAFRPPARDLRSELPLSRQPRLWTSSYTQVGFPDFSKKAISFDPNKEQRGVKTSDRMLKACSNPTVMYKIQTPITETYEVKNVIKDPIKIYGHSGINPQARFNGEMGIPTRIVQYPIRPEYNVGQSSGITKIADLSEFNTEKYTHDRLGGNFNTNVSNNYVMLNNITDETDVHDNIRDTVHVEYTAPRTSYEKYEHNDNYNRVRELPNYHVDTTRIQNIYKNIEAPERMYDVNKPTVSVSTERDFIGRDFDQNRTYNLRPTINAGNFESVPTMPTYVHEDQEVPEFDSMKTKLRQNVYDLQQERSQHIAEIPYRPYSAGGEHPFAGLVSM